MAMKRLGIILPAPGVYSRTNIVLNWAVILARSGYQLDLITPSSRCSAKIPFLSEVDARLLKPISLFEAQRFRYHALIASDWSGIAVMADIKSDHHAWLMQAYECQFLERNAPGQTDFDELVTAQLNVITTANWLQQHILRHYDLQPRQTFNVISGLDKSLWRPVRREPLQSSGRPVDFLVEGSINDPRKDVAHTIRIMEALGVHYRWVGTKVDRALIGPNCCGVEEQVPYHRMPQIYSSADVLVKTSSSEGMFGPPLEMFATGGTAVAWHVQGAEEYMSDRYNSYLVPMNSWSRLAEAIREMMDAPERIRSLQENALASAAAWPTWEDQAAEIVLTIESLVPFAHGSLVRQVAKNHFRSILHSQHLLRQSRRADAAATRADQAEARLTELHHHISSSRAWRFVRALQHGRRLVAPDRSRRWAYILRAGRVVWRAGRCVKLTLRFMSHRSRWPKRHLDGEPAFKFIRLKRVPLQKV